MSEQTHVRQVKAAHDDALLRLPNVTGVFTGEKTTGGRPTGQTAIVVTVSRKQDMPPGAAIPRAIDGVPTDVIEEVVRPVADDARYNPLTGGISVGACVTGADVGTLGCLVRDRATGLPMALSNYHVLAVTADWSPGADAVQPAPGVGVCGPDSIGSVLRAHLGGTVDGAVALLTGRPGEPTIADIGDVTGSGAASVGMAVRKRGRTTGLTLGSVTATDYTTTVDYSAIDPAIGSITFTNQVRIAADPTTPTFVQGGDSGSAIVSEAGRVVGLLFGSAGEGVGIANPIADVLNTLAVDVAAADAPIASVVSRPWHALTIGGVSYDLADAVIQNESLDQMTAVAQLAVWQEPNPDTGLTVTLDAVDLAAATMTPQFAGILNRKSGMHAPDGTSLIYYATGPLWRLNRTPQTDHDLSGLTDGEAIQAVLDLCNVTFDPADIADAGYVLGAKMPIVWRAGQQGWDVVRELDRVFAMATIEVGAGRVVRFAYDRAPDAALISRSFIAGQDVFFWRAGRDRGDLSAIQNWHQVTGATWEGADGCRYTPWAKAEGDNPKLPGSTRVAGPGFSSDIIQDEALAGATARRLMRWFNREPDTGLIDTANDPNLGPGRVIGLQDATAAIGLDGVAPYLVLSADRRGAKLVTLNLVGGAAGDEGTVTTGVQRVCNETRSDFNLPGSFTVPAIGVPPLLASVPAIGAPPDVGEPPSICVVTALDGAWTCGTTDLGQAADWTTAEGAVAAHSGGGVDFAVGGAITFASADAVDLDRLLTDTQIQSWELLGSFTLLTASSWMRIGVGDPAQIGDNRFTMGADFLGAGVSGADTAFRLFGPDTNDAGEGLPFASNEPIQFRLSWDHDTQTLSCVACQEPFAPITRSITNPSAVDGRLHPVLWISTDETGQTAATLHSLSASRDCGDPPVSGSYGDNFSADTIPQGGWVIENPTVSLGDVITLTDLGSAKNTAVSINHATQSWHLAGSWTAEGTDAYVFGVMLATVLSEATQAGFSVSWNPPVDINPGTGRFNIDAPGHIESIDFEAATAPGGSFDLAWNAITRTMTYAVSAAVSPSGSFTVPAFGGGGQLLRVLLSSLTTSDTITLTGLTLELL